MVVRGKAGRWLDAGCSAGTYVRLLAAHGAEVIGADYSLPSLHKAADRLGDQAVLTASDVRALPFAAASFDGALCFGVMQALADPRPALRELCRVVRPGGEVWIDALNRYSAPHWAAGAWRRVRGKPAHMRYDDPWRLARWLREAGAAQVELHWLPLVPGHWRLVGKLPTVPSCAACCTAHRRWPRLPATRWCCAAGYRGRRERRPVCRGVLRPLWIHPTGIVNA